MHKRFEHKDFEKKWQEKWQSDGLYDVDERNTDKEKQYVLVELPYPSGNLHIGHWYAFAVPDIYVRYLRMIGKDVIYPMGFDAFGLPAENAAIKRDINPREWTESNIDYMRKQLASMGASFTWNKTASTIDPDYYQWTQWMFTKFFENDIAYRGEAMVNWDPVDNTVIANEQVFPDGTSERSGALVEKKMMAQWMLRITDYADALVDDLDDLDWPEFIKESQRNWIGRSKGAEISFPLKTETKHFVIIHGKGRQSDEIWYKTLAERLRSLGHTVDTPNLPEAGIPNIPNWVETIQKECSIDENTTVIAHSFGTVAAMKVVEALEHTIERLVLVGGFSDPNFKDKEREHTFDWEFNFEKIISNAPDRRVLHCVPDHAVSDEQAKRLAESLDVSITPIKVHEAHGDDPHELNIYYHAHDSVNVFTTRADTLFGVTYLILAPEHELVQIHKDKISNWSDVEAYIKVSSQKDEQDRLDGSKEKTGVKLEGLTAINPVNGEEIPVYIADYVLAGYGTGAVMAVPGHDQRDNDFAEKYDLPITQVVRRVIGEPLPNPVPRVAAGAIVHDPETDKYLVQNSHEFKNHSFIFGGLEDGEDYIEAAIRETEEETGYKAKFVRYITEEWESHFYHPGKDINRSLVSRRVLLELTDKEQGTVSEEELKKAEPVWLTKDELIKAMQMPEEKLALEQLFNPKVYSDAGNLCNSGEYDGMNSEEAKEILTEKVQGKLTSTYRLRDWSIGRQRYWGVPIPIVYDPEGKAHVVPREHLPWTLPEDVDFKPTGEPPLAKSEELKNRTEEIFGEGWTPEVETMDTFVDSSWYFLRYLDNQNQDVFCSIDAQKDWMPIDMYFGGAEHTTMHLLYSRFWQKALKKLELAEHNEPYKRRINRSLILGPDGNKMSKSKGNVIDPDEQVERVGSDAVKMYLAFMGPYAEVNNYPWDLGGIAGIRRFLERVNGLAEHISQSESEETTKLLHKTIKKVRKDITEFKFNTAISAMMVFINHAEKNGLSKDSYDMYLQLLAPFAPHLTEELWSSENTESIHTQTYPEYSEELATDDEVTIGVQINGKLRGQITVSPDADQSTAESAAKANEQVAAKLEEGSVAKVIYVPGRILNFIVKS